VFADHYHSHLLRSPSELVNAIAYVLGNHAHHFGGSPQRDPFSSGAYDPPRREQVLSDPVSRLVCHGWKRARHVPQWLTAIGDQFRYSGLPSR
jgi:hypothetical protein